MSTVIERMLAMGDKKRVKLLRSTDFFDEGLAISTSLPVLNVALSGKLSGGMMPGLTLFAGASKSFKSLLALFMAKHFQKENKDGVILFYDSEFGSKPGYLEGFGIDTGRVVHIPIMNIEELLFDLTPRLEAINKGDKVFILIDSIGNLASKKEAQDALDGKSVQDMTRARALKGMFRTVTPYFALKGIYCVAIAHVYQTMCLEDQTNVMMADGSVKKMSELKLGDKLIGADGQEDTINAIYADSFLRQQWGNDLELYEIEMEDGTIIRSAGKHRFLNQNEEWTFVDEMSIGDEIMTI